jgi:hypothetical protein
MQVKNKAFAPIVGEALQQQPLVGACAHWQGQ